MADDPGNLIEHPSVKRARARQSEALAGALREAMRKGFGPPSPYELLARIIKLERRMARAAVRHNTESGAVSDPPPEPKSDPVAAQRICSCMSPNK
jgi:hypothetical protein